jgi:hypothetical protein
MKKNYYSAYNPGDFDWAKFYNLMYRPLLIVDDYSKQPGESKGQIVLSSDFNQEKKLIEKDNFSHLSEEAKEIIMTIMDTPDELIGMLTTTKTGKFCKRHIKRFFRMTKKWNQKKTERIFNELAEYVNGL